ncbi:hypothetical protein HYPSUDRAFT_716965 [Hypholoma sublateritium FD-334 SS-4]|uniref:Uncharacterized protein n=1 Tax=Hypholoma sublateritium (strain FD-334 SS-4) TaxID=945553 RepID=A0A0D2QAG3_HYPSF|nr:hypothetical protein HYPSUDRAFT_716965 [Hypholoma sublateritium FD-334 SS-4]
MGALTPCSQPAGVPAAPETETLPPPLNCRAEPPVAPRAPQRRRRSSHPVSKAQRASPARTHDTFPSEHAPSHPKHPPIRADDNHHPVRACTTRATGARALPGRRVRRAVDSADAPRFQWRVWGNGAGCGSRPRRARGRGRLAPVRWALGGGRTGPAGAGSARLVLAACQCEKAAAAARGEGHYRAGDAAGDGGGGVTSAADCLSAAGRKTVQGFVCSADCAVFADAALLRRRAYSLCAVKCFRVKRPVSIS